MRICSICRNSYEDVLQHQSLASRICMSCYDIIQSLESTCSQCGASLDRRSNFCHKCGHRHGMSDCLCCNRALFKHASVCVTFIVNDASSRGIFAQAWRSLTHRPIVEQQYYLHSYCASQRPDILKQAIKIENFHEHEVDLQNLNEGPDFRSGEAQASKAFAPAEIIPQPSSHSAESSLETKIARDISERYRLGERDFLAMNLEGSFFHQVDWSCINFQGADLIHSEWISPKLAKVDFSHVNLSHSRFRNATLNRANFQGAIVSHAKLLVAQMISAVLTESDFSYSDLYGSQLLEANLTGANLSYARLEGVNFRRACIEKVNLSRAQLSEADLSGASLKYSDLESVNLSWGDLQNATLDHCNLSKANMEHANVSGTSFEGANFAGANVQNCNLSEAASLKNSSYDQDTKFPLSFNPEAYGMIPALVQETLPLSH